MNKIGIWIPFEDHPGQTVVRTLYCWRNNSPAGYWFSQDSRLFSQDPLMRYIVPVPPEDAIRKIEHARMKIARLQKQNEDRKQAERTAHIKARLRSLGKDV